MLFILGIKHDKHQSSRQGNEQALSNLEKEFEKLIKENNIKLVAEEFNIDVAKNKGIEKTVAQEIAEKQDITYIYADPNLEERKKLGIRSRQDTAEKLGINIFFLTKDEENKINENHRDMDQLREEEWLSRIMPYIENDAIFLCGFEHTKSFKKLLTDKGYDAKIYKIVD